MLRLTIVKLGLKIENLKLSPPAEKQESAHRGQAPGFRPRAGFIGMMVFTFPLQSWLCNGIIRLYFLFASKLDSTYNNFY
jgi:hypothetical protein